MKKLFLFSIIFVVLISSNIYQINAATIFFKNSALTKNGVEWCEEELPRYKLMGYEWFEHHRFSIESRICANLYEDDLWQYTGPDRINKLIEKSMYFVELEIQESLEEAQKGTIDPTPVEPQPEKTEIVEKESEPNLENTNQSEDKAGGGCLIATATYGSELALQVQQLREIRDDILLQTKSGTSFMIGFNKLYYSFSPTVADWERENLAFKETVKIAITPLLSSLSLLNFVEINSEEEMLGYGISIILMNIGMYFFLPALAIIHFRKRFH